MTCKLEGNFEKKVCFKLTIKDDINLIYSPYTKLKKGQHTPSEQVTVYDWTPMLNNDEENDDDDYLEIKHVQ